MVVEHMLNYVFIYVLFEAYEIWWQRAHTLLGILARMYEHYKKSVWIFLLMQPTFYFALFFMMLCDYNFYSVLLFSIKVTDMLTKMWFIKKVFIQKDVSAELSRVLLVPINPAFIYLGLVLYPALIVLALT